MKKQWSHIVVLGAGKSGKGAVLLSKKHGYSVALSDSQKLTQSTKDWLTNINVTFEEKKHTTSFLSKADLIVKSPGIPYNLSLFKKINQKIKVIDEVEFSSYFITTTNIAITGTNGKTSTTNLIHHILIPEFKTPCLVGNIGNSVSHTLSHITPDLLVTELSSFQIEGLDTYHPNTVVITNITADHLDRYQNNFELYANTKWRLTQNLTPNDYLVLNADDKKLMQLSQETPTKANILYFSLTEKNVQHFDNYAYAHDKTLKFNIFNKQLSVKFDNLTIRGNHQKQNILASVLACYSVKPHLSIKNVRQQLKSFKNIEHRLESCGIIGGVEYINDSKATNVHAVKKALNAFSSPIIWIVGGVDKGNQYDTINMYAKKNVKKIICVGKDNSKILKSFSNFSISETTSMYVAVELAHKLAVHGDLVLLSPMCASFDLFKNHEERGNIFKKAVLTLKMKGGNNE